MLIAVIAAISLRIFNPNEAALDANVRCSDGLHSVRLEPREVRDFDACTDAESILPVLALSTRNDDGREWQEIVSAQLAACGTAPMAAPLFGCSGGEATAYVDPIDGASYSWTVEGATILSGAGTHRVTLRLGTGPVARLDASIATAGCTRVASGVIAIRQPIEVSSFVVPPSAEARQPVTISWSYAQGREPASQLLTGNAFGAPVVLAPQQRSYTFTPALTGARTVELRASYANALAVAPPKRRRATAGSGISATECPAVRATRPIEVRGCSTEAPGMDAPTDADPGEAFAVSVMTANDDRVEWSVENGSVQSNYGSTVVVVAGASGKVIVNASVQRAGGCVASATAEVPIILSATQCPNPPQAVLTLLGHDCDSARVAATFTGTPPFVGEWSDGTDFETWSTTLSHEFAGAGPLTMNRFRDASCYGNVAALALPGLQARVTLTGAVSCSTGRLTATLEGQPPFQGTWSDGQTFTTSDTSIERTVGPGDWSVVSLTDSACSRPSTSGVFHVPPLPTARMMEDEPYCQESQYGTYATAIVDGGQSPYLIVWSDGHVSQSSSRYVSRNFPYAKTPSRTWTIDRVIAGGCEGEVLEPKNATVLWRDYGWFGPPTAHSHCVATDVTKSVIWVPEAPGAQLTWTLDNPDVKIVAGQGTPTVTLRSEKATTATLRVETTYPDGFCKRISDSDKLTFRGPSSVNAVQIVPDTIKPYSTAQILISVGGVPESLSVSAARGRVTWNGATNTGIYGDTVGTPGTVPITVTWSDPCLGTREVVATLTIAP